MGKIVSGIFGGGQEAPQLPAPTPVQAAPDPTPIADESTIARKKKEALARQQTRGGRSSTIISGDSDTLG